MRALLLTGIAILVLTIAPAFSDVAGFSPTEVLRIDGVENLSVLADIDGDGLPDVVTTDDEARAIVVLRYAGAGSFEALSTTPSGFPIESIDAADLDGDGDTDLFLEVLFPSVISGWTPGIASLMNDGAGTFTFRLATLSESLEEHTLADVDGDGDVDVVYQGSWHSGPPSLKVLRNGGDGQFYAGLLIVLPDRVFGHALGDLDHDGQPELAVEFRQETCVYRNLGGGAFSTTPDQTFHGHDRPTFADIDGDSNLDLVDLGEGPYIGLIEVRWGAGDGSLSEPETVSGAPGHASPRLVDLGADGDLDLVASTPEGLLWFRENLGSRVFGDPLFHRLGDAEARFDDALVVDLDGDAETELFLFDGAVAYVVETGGDPVPRVTDVEPRHLEPDEVVQFGILGSGFTPDSQIEFRGDYEGDLELLDVVCEGDDRLTVTVRTPAGDRDLPNQVIRGEFDFWVWNPTGGSTYTWHYVVVHSWWSGEIRPGRATLRDSAKAGKDRFEMKGEIRGVSPDELTSLAGHDLTLRFGDPAAMEEITIPGDAPGWRFDAAKGKIRYKSPSGDRPRIRLSFKDVNQENIHDRLKAKIDIRGLDIGTPPTGDIRTEIWLGDVRLLVTRTYDEVKAGKFKFRD